ncbi:FHA domain-containing protein [Dechloromonas sp. XY25]|uniref:FHA domain-containing protein n=1 Tax=Dechloromonas hankyongensis TaxID=2908002 RepID=A0ABS9K7M2_9RHOO|nr:FHA domain-containing protein [Dechloromonas hankyongensis]MCG2579163.1 FHA domain-containing protein [Dechloromonas hankyongensis]
MPLAQLAPAANPEFTLLLKCLSHPQMEDIRIEDSLFAIGRNEPPFVSCEPTVVAKLSRRQARIFSEFGAVYIADLGSKNGTTVNGVAVRQKPCQLQDGDEIRFGGELAFRLQLGTRAVARERAARLLSLTLVPENVDFGLQPIVIAHFPFLVSKTDAIFAAYRQQYPQQANYVSRRHAHIFLKNGMPFVEDLGSTNGTFVDDRRLDEHAVALKEGDVLAFGGRHLMYRVSLQTESLCDTTMTRLRTPTVPAPADADKTTFVAAADSFLDIFCIDPAPQADDEMNDEAAEAPTAPDGDPGARLPRTRFALVVGELRGLLAAAGGAGSRRVLIGAMALAAGVAVLALGFYVARAPERELEDLLASGAYAEAASVAKASLERHPDNAKLKARGSEALLKANLPNWLARIKGRDFAGAAAVVAAMQDLAAGNDEVQPLVKELAWLGNLEQFVSGQGQAQGQDDVPIRIYADEERIAALLKGWDDNVQGHQRAFTAISAQVPEFRDWYADALSHLRKLQSDNSVYLAAIDRLKASIATELKRDQPEALKAVFSEYAGKYPRLGGLDDLQKDLQQYIALQNEMQAGSLGPLIAKLGQANFSTPPFQDKLRALAAAGRLPPAAVVAQYEGVASAWRAGDSQGALADLQKLEEAGKGGAWSDAAAREIKHKREILERFAELQKARGGKGYDERLLAFYGLLDLAEDMHFVDATAADLAAIKEQALKQAQEQLSRAQARWRQYRDNGPIDTPQRLESEISGQFRSQARLLADADDEARQGARIYSQLKVDLPGPLREVREAIQAEAEQQRNALLELRQVLEPRLLKAKLELMGGGGRHGP